jgi:hypothetical protein
MLNQIAPLQTLHELQLKAKNISYLELEYRFVYMIMDVAHNRLCGPPGFIDQCELKDLCRFLHLTIVNEGTDAINSNNILNHKKYSPVIRFILRRSPHLVFHTNILSQSRQVIHCSA